MSKDDVVNHIQDTCIELGYTVRSPQDVARMIPKFEAVIEKYGNIYCPCMNVQNSDTVCPCRHMRDFGACRCGLFIKGE